jgi:hypothetical protein
MATSPKKQKQSKLNQESVMSVWCAYFLRRAELERKRRAERGAEKKRR